MPWGISQRRQKDYQQIYICHLCGKKFVLSVKCAHDFWDSNVYSKKMWYKAEGPWRDIWKPRGYLKSVANDSKDIIYILKILAMSIQLGFYTSRFWATIHSFCFYGCSKE